MDDLHTAAYERDELCLNETEFLEYFQMKREAFFRLVELVRYHSALVSSGYCRCHGGAELHMLVLLKCIGSFGNDVTWSKQAQFLGLGKGTIGNYLHRASGAVVALEDSTLVWPHASYFVNCIGLVNGTLLRLEFKQ
ncbi:hypothetical protein PHPALM_29748 [Phytophthora palmivora]|uniref:Uncharacterized protein n=1 Tax=Phytophthora palmivora TaxID=4796 RepID=A0A2P4X6U2_9STRA|nr:hypothetical protein PHPALM_29748 [Phytophthora palmivora]